MPTLKDLTTQFPEDIRFKFPWRKYQQRVLDDLQGHLDDGYLHIVAPPGSGKTILVLEVARRLNKPTLILAPTTAIRNQWIQRFCDPFLQSAVSPDWITKDIRNPKSLRLSPTRHFTPLVLLLHQNQIKHRRKIKLIRSQWKEYGPSRIVKKYNRAILDHNMLPGQHFGNYLKQN